jgi:DNA-directed RNA polymerase subunit M/transcription elongation factor TFIIS
MLEFSCPQCSQTIRASEDQAGQVILCPKCGQQARVPGQGEPKSKTAESAWSVFEEDEQFIEESVTTKPETKYKVPEDDREPLVNTDNEAVQQEDLEEKQAAAEAQGRAKSIDSGAGPPSASGLTIEEKMAEEARLKELTDKLPSGSLPGQKAWSRDRSDTPEPIPLDTLSQGDLRACCRVCESVLLVRREKAGTQITCPDCGSVVPVPTVAESTAAEKQKSQHWKTSLPNKEMPQPEQPRSGEDFFGVAGDGGEDYGLAPPAENLLAPLPVVSAKQDGFEGENGSPGSDEPAAQSLPPTDPKQTSELFEEMQAAKDEQFELLPFSRHVLNILSDPGFVIRVMISAGIMLLGFSIFYVAQGFANSEIKALTWVGKFIQLGAFPFIPIGFLAICWIGQLTLNATIVGAKKLPDLGSVSLIQFVSNTLFVAIGFALAAAPGVLLGWLAWTLFKEWPGFWFAPALGTFTAMVFAPILILSAMYNRLPYQIYSKEIMDSLKPKYEWWIEFYCFAFFMAILTGSFWLLGLFQSWLVTAFMFVVINLCCGVYFRMLGRLMGCIVNRVESWMKGDGAG